MRSPGPVAGSQLRRIKLISPNSWKGEILQKIPAMLPLRKRKDVLPLKSLIAASAVKIPGNTPLPAYKHFPSVPEG